MSGTNGQENTKTLNLKLKVWRQKSSQEKGRFEMLEAPGISADMSFLEMLDVVNGRMIEKGGDPVAFDHDCREGICGACSMVINGNPHGPQKLTTTCQLHMRKFKDGETITIEPFRAKAFPVLKDLVVDRSALDRIVAAGGFISINTGNAQDANSIPVSKENADLSFDAAACIGCGACVAACKNASASLFVSAKLSQLALLPQGQPERERRAISMVAQMDQEKFGSCSTTKACEAACPKGITLENIARMNREFARAKLRERPARHIADA